MIAPRLHEHYLGHPHPDSPTTGAAVASHAIFVAGLGYSVNAPVVGVRSTDAAAAVTVNTYRARLGRDS